MLNIAIPSRDELQLEYLVSDYNGTLARDGKLLPGVAPLLQSISSDLKIFVITADTFGLAKDQLQVLPIELTILPADNQDQGKLDFIKKLGVQNVAAIGNGRNDKFMLKEAALGICLIEGEGACVETLLEADITCRSVEDALSLLLNPKRMIATLRR